MLLRLCLSCFHIPARGEKLFGQWRTVLDWFLTLFIWVCLLYPASYWSIRASLCEDAYVGKEPFAASIQSDPWLNTFPCGRVVADAARRADDGKKIFNMLHTLKGEPPESMAWMAQRWWWVTPYVMGYHCTNHFAGIAPLTPVLISVPYIFFPWWSQGGRALSNTLLRGLSALENIRYLALEGSASANPYTHVGRHHYCMHSMMLRLVIGGVQWRLQVPLGVFEAVTTVVAHAMAEPLTATEVMELSIYTGIGTAAGLLVSYIEHHILLMLDPRGAGQDARALGPVHALITAWNWAVWWIRRGSWDLVMHLVYAASLLACVLWITFQDDSIILIF